ncbi:hypothetical protein KC19_3G028300 [Ceratodon purpureus]|uniref:15-cis-phytoene synthase n=1 Tax=Ceratodon purpureus TaxID=3225 RepID=A0A8T0IE57_CERPU|nr:hypothetical protein KC19_3G028300 [Ceratodon purpureus]
MQTVGLRAASSTASLCWGESFLAGTSSSSGTDGSSALLALRGARRGASTVATSAGAVAPRAVLSQRQESGGAAVRDKGGVRVQSSTFTEPLGRNFMSAEQRVYEAVAKQVAIVEREQSRSRGSSLIDVRPDLTPVSTQEMLDDAYTRCGEVCAEYAKTFYLGTKLMTPERQRAIWAIYVWCRRTDELVDGPNASRITPTALDRWEDRLEDIFRGQPYDMLDAALADTVSKFPVDIQPFRDMIDGMRMDLVKSRYANFDELYMYCYNVAGTVGLMSVPIMGIDPESKATTQSVYNGALALGIANQLTNILRDVGEDARRGRIYLPQDELARFGLTDEDIMAGKVTDKWRAFMKDQIKRARVFFAEAENSVRELDNDSRWPVWSALLLYQQILDAVEANDYDNFTKRAYVNKWQKFATLPIAYGRALVKPPAASPAKNLVRSL